MEKISLQFRDKAVQSVLQRGQSKFVQLSFESGQGLTKHRAPLALTVVVLTGQIRFTIGDSTEVLEASEMVAVGPNVEHAVEAIRRSTVLLVLTSDGEARSESLGHTHKPDHENAFQRPDLIEQIAPELRPLVEDHIAVCKVLQSIGENSDGGTIGKALRVIDQELRSHFVVEEEVLFPRMANHVGGMDVGPVARLIEEHARIRQLHAEAESLQSACDKEEDEHAQSLLTAKMVDLSTALLNHLGKEDSHLFPMASRLLTSEEKDAVREGLQKYKVSRS